MNRFSGLNVEESFQQDPEMEASNPTHGVGDDYKLIDTVPVTILKSEEDIKSDFLFAIISFFQEIEDVRHHIRGCWSDYRKGRFEIRDSFGKPSKV